MNRQQLRKLARQRLNDSTAPLLWSDEELNDFIGQAVDEAAIRSRSILDSTTAACCSIAAVAAKSAYPLHPSVFQIKRVYDITNQTELKKTSFEELDDFRSSWQSDTGNPTHYIDDFNHYGDDSAGKRSVTLYPIPTINASIKLTVYRVPLDELDDGSEPELPSFQHADLIWWVCYLAYLKQDADAVNVGKSAQFEQKFIEAFGKKQDARKLEWRRKNRAMRVHGNYF